MRVRRRHNIFLSLILAFLLSACAVPSIPSRIIYEDPTSFVRLEPDPNFVENQPETYHSHPATISPEQMAQLLKGFQVREHRNAVQRRFVGEAPRVRAFQNQEIALLAPRLSEALAKAEPHERVTFYLSYPQTSVKREITSGGLYVRGTDLHFNLGNYRIIYGIPAYGMVYDRRYPMMPTAPKGFDLFFEPAAAVVKQKRRLWDTVWGREKDELVIDLRKLGSLQPVASLH